MGIKKTIKELGNIFLNRKRHRSNYFRNSIVISNSNNAEFIRVIPVGDFPDHPDGPHSITPEHLKQMQFNIEQSGLDILFDYGHNSLWDPGAEAAGWSSAENVTIRPDGLYVKYPQWTADAGEKVEARIYRYLSPAYVLSSTDKQGKQSGARLLSIALTNTPYMDSEIQHIGNSKANSKKDEKKMNEEILKFLGIPADADEETVKEKLAELRKKLELSEDATIDQIVEAKADNDKDVESNIDSPAEGEEDSKSNSAIEKRIAALEESAKQSKEDKVSALISSAIEQGKILPADKAVFINSARGDYEATKKLLDNREANSAMPGKVDKPAEGSVKVNSIKACADYTRTEMRSK